MTQEQLLAAVGITSTVAFFLLKRTCTRILEATERTPSEGDMKRILAAIDRIPSAETFREWSRKLELLDTDRLSAHYAKVHDLSNIVGKHELLIQQHEKRINRIEYEGPERRKEPRQ